MFQKVTGLATPPVTPFTKDGDVDYAKIKVLVDHISSQNFQCIFVNGTTGEFANLTLEERKQTAETWMKEARNKIDIIIIQVGADNVKNSIDLAQHAESLGADAIACVAPSYFKGITADDYVEYMQTVAAAAPNTPFYLYDIQPFTSLTVSAYEFFKRAHKKIPTLVGLKHTTPDYISMNNIITSFPEQKYNLILGTDESFLEGLVIGADTTICNTYMGHIFTRLLQAFKAGDLDKARAEQAYAFQITNMRRKYGLGPADGTKAVLAALDIDVGQCRLPLPKYSEQTVASIKKDLQEMGFFDKAMNNHS